MATERPKVGQQITISSGAMLENAVVTDVWDYADDHQTVYVVEYRTESGRNEHYTVCVSEDFSKELTKASGMPYYDRADAFKWDYYGANMDAVKKIANSYVEDWRTWRAKGMGLYIFSGVNGSGKTFLACCIGNEIVCRYNSQVEFVTVNDYIGMLVENKDRAAELRDSVLLIVDDIGAQNEKQDWIRDSIFRLVDYRYRAKLPTIYTSNMPLQLASKNDRVTSRMFELSHEVKLPEVSVREIIATKAKKEFLSGVMAA